MVWGFSSAGCGGHKHRRDVSDHWWHHLRDWPRFLQTKKLQCKNRNGISHCHTLFTSKRSFKKWRSLTFICQECRWPKSIQTSHTVRFTNDIVNISCYIEIIIIVTSIISICNVCLNVIYRDSRLLSVIIICQWVTYLGHITLLKVKMVICVELEIDNVLYCHTGLCQSESRSCRKSGCWEMF